MSSIVCATRGGQGSRAVQLEAIEIARETGERLIFLYVVNLSAVEDHEEVLVGAIRSEFHWLGRVLLHVARQRAERAGVEAEIAIREGDVTEEIERFLEQSDARLLLLGAPRGTTPRIFGDDAIEKFAQTIEQDTGVKVEVARP